jgi:hypothetical protein
MEALGQPLSFLVRHAAIVPVLLLFLLALFVWVMSRNWRCLRNERVVPDLIDSEQILDELVVDWGVMRTYTLLTNHRVLQIRLSWFLSKRKEKRVSLKDVHSVVWRRWTNWLYLLAGVWFLGTLNPLALLLTVFGLSSKIYSIRFDTPFAQMPWTRVAVVSFWRCQLGDFWRFYRNARSTWARTRAGVSQLITPISHDTGLCEQDFRWGRAVWVYLTVFMLAALVQRLSERHVSYDDYFFGPLYLALPAAAATRSVRDAAWGALLGAAGLFTIKFPSSGLVGMLAGDGGRPYFEQYLLVAAFSVIVVLLAAVIATRVTPSLAFLAPSVWLVFIRLHSPTQVKDFSLYSKVSIAMALTVILLWVERRISPFYESEGIADGTANLGSNLAG